MSNSGLRRVIGASAVAAVAAVGLASMGAGTAAAKPLPNGSKTTVGVDGSVVKLSRTGEKVFPIRTESNNGIDRGAEVTGSVFATFPKGDAGVLNVGYVVGCQVDITNLSFSPSISFNQGINLLSTNGTPLTLGAAVSPGLTIPLTPGQAKLVEIGEKSGDSGTLGVQYQQVRIDLTKCGGYASARSVATIELRGDNYVKSTLYGTPFSLN
ncbi:MspA family porin [Williamsia herbipolensis]|uniref:MspA family porin n=1 Tax=Williamsia herbipolensis TaxID=1603258 RepID=UPI001EF0467D|nr:MspA family porin [Williamsia herbipolensis]